MNSKTALGLIAVLIIGILLFLFLSGNGSDKEQQDLIGEGTAVYRTTLADTPTAQGFMYIPFVGSSQDYSFINVALDVNGDGTYAAYETPRGTQEERVIVNEMPDISGQANRLPFEIIDPEFGSVPIHGTVVISKDELQDGVWPETLDLEMTQVQTFTIDNVILEARDVNRSNDGTGERATGGFPLVLQTNTVYARGEDEAQPAEVPPGTEYVSHSDVPDQDQRYNECGPTSVANSFRWLAEKYNVADRIPRDPTNLVDEIKGDLDWDDGVSHADMIKGKQDFIDRHQLPFEAHQIGSEDDPQLIQKIRDELAKGQAVEAWIIFQNASGTTVGAHLVTVAGAGKNRHGVDAITFTDPDTKSPDGSGSRDVYRVNSTNYLPAYAPGLKTFIRYAYAQSPIQSITDGTWVDPLDDGAISTGQTSDQKTLPGVTRTTGRSKFGFFDIVLPHPGDHYVGDTFTYEAAVTRRNVTRSIEYRDASGAEKTWEYGAESPWSLNGVFRTSGPLSPNEILERPDNMRVLGDRATAADTFTCTASGVATISYAAGFVWTRAGDPPPPQIMRGAHGAEFNETTDTMTVRSPEFRCLPLAGGNNEPLTESHTSVIDSFCPGFTEDPEGKEIDVLRKGNECYPALQFHVAGPDVCKEDHWHANTGTANSLTGGTWTDPNGCGFGEVSKVPTGKVKLSPDDAVRFLPL